MLLQLDTYIRHIRILGAIAIAICVATWAMDLAGAVYLCPYCRTQRSVIGVLGLMMMLPNPGHWISRYIGTVLGVLGLVVAAEQHFNGWKKVWGGTFSMGETWYLNSFLLAGAAMFIITAQVMLLHLARQRAVAAIADRPPARHANAQELTDSRSETP